MSETDDPNPSGLTYEEGFEAVVARMQARQEPLSFDTGEALPALDVDFAPLKRNVVQKLDLTKYPRVKDRSGNTRKIIELNEEFLGKPELCLLHALLISHLRKSAQPEHTMALFTRIWVEESTFLFEHLDPRWLVSALTTFGDHGQTEVQRRVGQSMTVLFASMKLYETERLYSGFRPDQEFKLKRLVRHKLPLNMDRFVLSGGGLDVNTLARLWLDAKEDAVIAPLAHRLLDLLNRDPHTMFRRLKILRGRQERQQNQRRNALLGALDPRPADATPVAGSWGIVATVKAPIEVLVQFIEHHLALGASQIFLFLDEAMSPEDMAKMSNPEVVLITCDAEYWKLSETPRMKAHQHRQAYNATRAYLAAQTEWIAHIDCDEFLHSDKPIDEFLRSTDTATEALIMPPAQEISRTSPSSELLFRRTYFDAGREKSVIRELFPTFGEYLKSGFISHTAGKTMARTGLPDVTFGIHQLRYKGDEELKTTRVQTINVLHRHASDWPTFQRHMKYRIANGSYRNPGQSLLPLKDIIEALNEEHGDEGAKRLFDEICLENPAQIKRLEQEEMLIRTTLKARKDG
ncbi:glycosyltransferase family 2 protein [Planktotalea sp.]|uniref:glycosyltransferase family 2 protein n=1 Tax=Planktotalea sp. TaxID=2029877 RepID=UPI003297850C